MSILASEKHALDELEKAVRSVKGPMERARRELHSIERQQKHARKPIPHHGIDYAYGKPDHVALHKAGIQFVCRYLSHTPSKNLTAVEAEELSHHGISIVTVWESTANRALYGYTGGVEDAKDALAMAEAVKQPSSAPIYFATDFEVTKSDMVTVADYFKGCADVLGRDRVGLYGGIAIIDHVALHRYVGWRWQTYAWSGGKWSHRTNIRQYKNGVTVAGVSCDLDIAVTQNYGQWEA